jgi:hypothetical protein
MRCPPSSAAYPDRAPPRSAGLQPRRRGMRGGPAPGGRRGQRRGVKSALNFLLCCRCCQAPLRMFFSRHSLGAVPHAPVGLATSFGVGTDCLQRPALRASSKTRHPMLSASFDNNWKVCRRRPHLSDGFFAGPGSLTGRLHQHHGQSLTQHHWRLRFALCPLW